MSYQLRFLSCSLLSLTTLRISSNLCKCTYFILFHFKSRYVKNLYKMLMFLFAFAVFWTLDLWAQSWIFTALSRRSFKFVLGWVDIFIGFRKGLARCVIIYLVCSCVSRARGSHVWIEPLFRLFSKSINSEKRKCESPSQNTRDSQKTGPCRDP